MAVSLWVHACVCVGMCVCVCVLMVSHILELLQYFRTFSSNECLSGNGLENSSKPNHNVFPFCKSSVVCKHTCMPHTSSLSLSLFLSFSQTSQMCMHKYTKKDNDDKKIHDAWLTSELCTVFFFLTNTWVDNWIIDLNLTTVNTHHQRWICAALKLECLVVFH